MDEFMIFLGFTIGLICLFILLARTGNILTKVSDLQKKIILLSSDLATLRSELAKLRSGEIKISTQEEKKPVEEKKPIVEEKKPIVEEKPNVEEKPIVILEKIDPPIKIKEETPEPIKEKDPLEFDKTKVEEVFVDQKNTSQKTNPTRPVINKEPSFFEKNPDLEKFIGENLINKIGIGILVIGIGFFVKFAIDQDWINEIGRVFIGILCGGILVGFAHYLRNTFKAFSSVLVGGGMAVFYLTIGIAFHEYQLMSQTLAFIIMVIITAFSVVLAIAYDRKELAVLALIGGFSSPFMVSTGSGNYQVLFTYILILNIGMLALSYFKRWNVINVISFVFTVILFGAWLTKIFTDGTEVEKPYTGALIFATLFYLTFFMMNILNNIKENKKFLGFEIGLILANTACYYSAGMIILSTINEGLYQGSFTAMIGVFNFVFAFALYKSKKVDLNLVYMLIGLVLTFLTLAAPIQLKGNYITLFWAGEAVLMLWLSQKSGIKLMKITSVIVTVLMLISLMMDWGLYKSTVDPFAVIFNRVFITGLVVIGSLVGSTLLLTKEEDVLFGTLTKKAYASILEVSVIVMSYLVGLLEVLYQFRTEYTPDLVVYPVTSVYTGCYNLGFIVAMSVYIHVKKIKWMEIIPIALGILISLAYMVYYNREMIDLRDEWLVNGTDLGFDYYFHYLNVALLALILTNALRLVNANYKINTSEYNAFLWVLCGIGLFVFSAELEHLVVVSQYEPGADISVIKHHNYKVGFPILWGVLAFTIMAIGMKLKIKTLRVISLTVFCLTLLKLFIFDVREMSEGGKIAAFISLGVLLLIMSFMYQKLKKLFTEE